MKWVSIVGARPQFIKLAAFCRSVAQCNQQHPERKITHRIIHTGQHYDADMSDIFFDRLALPVPDVALGIGSGTHARQTAEMMIGIEEVLQEQRPDQVILYGDTNSTLAGGLVAAKLGVPVAHVEAGLRSGQMHMPEEINRILVDRVATTLFCPSRHAEDQLRREGIIKGVHVSGDIMYDVLKDTLSAPDFVRISLPEGIAAAPYLLLTLHRAEITAAPDKLLALLQALDYVSHTHPIYFPVHPRTRAVLSARGWQPQSPHFHLAPPQPYAVMLKLAQQARVVLTDSGGLQKEAYWLRTPCITLRDTTEWQELVEIGWNAVAGWEPQSVLTILERVLATDWESKTYDGSLYGEGNAATRMIEILMQGSGSP